MQPIATRLAVDAVRAQANSARPSAPIQPDRPQPPGLLRLRAAAFLRASAQRRARWADRLEHAPVRLAHR
ncbi:hypothetical protein [Nocardia sp. NPDC048505]|uniref:hypothetical protein n=1 Tax=unclassified Nocardia TaxID=2637762 RepID=UPI0033E00027